MTSTSTIGAAQISSHTATVRSDWPHGRGVVTGAPFPATTTVEFLHQKLALAATKSLVNYGFYMGAASDGTGCTNLRELRAAYSPSAG